jgi:UDP:flavonoid glycosyltransferase YjiC (YdhE family)
MTSYLFTTLPTNDLGLLTRSLPIAKELAGRGHRVLFSSPAAAPRRLVADAGFENRPPAHPLYDLLEVHNLSELVAYLFSSRRRRHGALLPVLRRTIAALPLRRAAPTPEVWNMGHAGATMGMLNPGFVRASVEGLRTLIMDSGVDVVVDFWNPFAVMAARSLGRPVVTVIQADAHPSARGFIWWKDPPGEVPTPVPAVNSVLAELGLPAIARVEELCVGDLTLVVGTPGTDPLPDGAAVRYLGPLLWEQPGAALPPVVSSLPRDRPLIWVYSGNPRYSRSDRSLGSMVVLEASVAALRDMDLTVVLSTGHHPLPRRLLPLPANFRHVPFVPGLAMARRADLIIHHGGYGSCQTGLTTGTPAVILPTYSERESNARRVAALGAAIMVPVEYRDGKKRVPISELSSAVARALTDPSFRARAQALSRELQGYGGAALAADLIEGMGWRPGLHSGATPPAIARPG